MKNPAIALVILASLFGIQSLPAQTAPSPSHVAAAHELFDVMRLDEVSTRVFRQMSQGAQPATVEIAAVMKRFHDKYFSPEVWKAEHTRIYTAQFSESELRELAAFFRTPIGQKFVAFSLDNPGAEFARRIMNEHGAELRDELMQALRRQ